MFSHCYRNETLTGHLPERTWAELEQSDCITHVLPPQLRWQWSSAVQLIMPCYTKSMIFQSVNLQVQLGNVNLVVCPAKWTDHLSAATTAVFSASLLETSCRLSSLDSDATVQAEFTLTTMKAVFSQTHGRPAWCSHQIIKRAQVTSCDSDTWQKRVDSCKFSSLVMTPVGNDHHSV